MVDCFNALSNTVVSPAARGARAGPDSRLFGRPRGMAADSGASTPDSLRRSARMAAAAVPRADPRLWEKPATSRTQRRECEHRETFPVADPKRHRREVPGTGEQHEIGTDHGDPIQHRGRSPPRSRRKGWPTALSTRISVEMKPSVNGKPTLARPVSRKQTAKRRRVLVKAVVLFKESRPNRASRAGGSVRTRRARESPRTRGRSNR